MLTSLRELPVTRRLVFWFALMGYFFTFLHYYGPLGIAYGPLRYVLPFWMCILTSGGMPVPAVALIIAPINSAAYGIAGLVVGWILPRLLGRARGNFAKVRTISS